jgi:hypothetical protein
VTGQATSGRSREQLSARIGLPLHNLGPASPVKTWIDHLVAPGLSIDAATMTGLLGGREIGKSAWSRKFITAELTLAGTVPGWPS